MYALSMSEARALTEEKTSEQTKEGFSEKLVNGLAEVGLALRPGAMPLCVQEASMLPDDTNLQAPDVIAQLTRKQKKKLLK